MGAGHSEKLGATTGAGAPPPSDSEPSSPNSPIDTGKQLAKVILVSDPGQDLDDEMAMIMLRYLVEMRHCTCLGVIATLTPAMDRARLLRGTLDLLGLRDVPIGVGSDGGDLKGQHQATFLESAQSYMPARYSECAATLQPGRKLLSELYKTADAASITLVIIASVKDPALFLRDNEGLFSQKTKEVVIMGGASITDDQDAPLEPDTAHNNMFDQQASTFFYKRVQQLGIRLVVVTRQTAYAAPMPRSVYDELAVSGSSIGVRLRNAQRASIEKLWTRACAPPGSGARQGLPERCTRDWFLGTFCSGKDGTPPRGPQDTIWDLVDGFMQYDTLALLAAVPTLRENLFDPVVIRTPRVEHMLIGRNEKEPGIKRKQKLISMMEQGFSKGLAINHHYKSQVIVVTQLRWDNHADMLVACTILRSLHALGLLDCLGVLISIGTQPDQQQVEARCPTDSSTGVPKGPSGGRLSVADMAPVGKETIDEQAKDIQEFLIQLGLSHVPVVQIDATVNLDPLKNMYDNAAPSGVTLVVTASATEVTAFARTYPNIFRERTQRLIIMGGALITSEKFLPADDDQSDMPEYTGNLILEPDPAAQNNRLDMNSAEGLYRIAQELSVPIVALSRFLAKACCVPRAMFDSLGTHGGDLGARICQSEKDSIQELWRRACATGEDRRGLAIRCNREWFVQTFCPKGEPESDDDIWSAVESFNVYNALGVCAALPKVVERFLDATPVPVRSATHYVVGLSQATPGVDDPNQIRRVLYHSLFQGALINSSTFDTADPPSLPLQTRKDDAPLFWEYNRSEDALQVLLPSCR